jgi:hypothetical protein
VRRRPLGHKKRPVPDAGFAAVTDEVSRLYGEGRYQDGADLVARARPHLPERDCPLTFWEGCCQSMAGNPEPAVEILRAGTARASAREAERTMSPLSSTVLRRVRFGESERHGPDFGRAAA